MKSIQKERLLLINGLIFIVLYVLLSYFNRPAHDDFYSMYMIDEYGVVGGVLYQYQQWSSRFTGVFVSFFVNSIPSSYNYFLYNLFLLLFTCLAFYQLLKQILITQKRKELLLYTIFFVSILFYTTIGIGETWFWLSASASYPLGFAIFILIIAFLLKKENKFYHFFIVAIFSFLLGGMHEVLAGMMLCIHLLLLLFRKRITLNRNQITTILLSLIALSIALWIVLQAPGNGHRKDFFASITPFDSLLLNIKMTGILLLKIFLPRIPLFLFGGIGISILLRKTKWNFEKITNQRLAFLLIGIMGFIFFYQLPITYQMQDIMPNRGLLPLTFLVIISCGVLFRVKLDSKIKRNYLPTALVLFLCFQIGTIGYLGKTSYVYAKAYDTRMKIIAHHSSQETLIVKSLPNSGWLYSAELSNRPNHFTNQHLRRGMKLNFDVIREK